MPRSAAPTAFAGGGSEPSWWEHTQHGGPQAWASWDPRGLWLSLFRSAERLCNKGGRRKGQESRRQRASFGDRGIRTAASVSEERDLGEHWTNLDPRHVSYFLPQPRPQLLGPFRSWARLPCPRPPLQPVTPRSRAFCLRIFLQPDSSCPSALPWPGPGPRPPT